MSMSILIAEDNVAQRHYLREILEKEFSSHAPVIEAADGEETVKLALEHRPDVCILDIQMPKLNGFEVLEAIKADPRLRTLPVIMLTTSDREEDWGHPRDGRSAPLHSARGWPLSGF